MSSPEFPPRAEVLLRVQLSKVLSEEDLGRLSLVARREGSLDAAVVQVLRAGLDGLAAASVRITSAGPTGRKLKGRSGPALHP